MASVADPEPDDGVTWSQGCEGVALHVTFPAPTWVSRTFWGDVCERKVVPFVTAPKRSNALSRFIMGALGSVGVIATAAGVPFAAEDIGTVEATVSDAVLITGTPRSFATYARVPSGVNSSVRGLKLMGMAFPTMVLVWVLITDSALPLAT